MITPRFRHLPAQLRPLVDKFYRDHRSPMRSQAGDELWVTESASEIVAALSLRPVAGGQWLTGLFVAPALRRIGFNGRTAARFERQFAREGYEVHILPSTSPAYTLAFEEKAERWKSVVKCRER